MGGATTADTSAGYGALAGLQDYKNSAYGNIAENAFPEWVYQDPVLLDKILKTQSQLAYLTARQSERELNPAAAAAREAADQQVSAAVTGELDPATQRAMMSSGLADVLSSGTGRSLSSSGGFGKNRLSDMYGKAYQSYLANARNEANQRFGLQPEAVSMSGTDAANMNLANKQGVASSINAAKETIAGLGASDVQNAYNQWQQQMQSAGQLASNNANAKNMARARNSQMLLSAATAPLSMFKFNFGGA